MENLKDLREEQAYTAKVQRQLLKLIEQAQEISRDHLQSIQAIVADAWEDLRVKPTALSEEDMEQLFVLGEKLLQLGLGQARRRQRQQQAQHSDCSFHHTHISPGFLVRSGACPALDPR